VTDFAIRAESLAKSYRLGRIEPYKTLRDAVTTVPRRLLARGTGERRPWLWALDDVSFEVGQGEVVGLIGANGAGKTTLLRILSKITAPTRGRGLVSGRVGSLLEVGTGFHPELTGRDNVYLNGIILGMQRREIAARFDEIVEFAGVGRFIDTPVKRYSSGMQVRLAFSVAAHLHPEVLLVDEVLAVGDAEFQRRSLGRMENVTREGRTVVFVSHNMTAIRKLCSRAILLERGRIAMDGPTGAVLDRYLGTLAAGGEDGSVQGGELERRERMHAFEQRVLFRGTEISTEDAEGLRRTSFNSDEEVVISVSYDVYEPVTNLQVILHLHTEDGETILRAELQDDPRARDLYVSTPGSYRVRCRLPANLFGEKTLLGTVHLICQDVQHVTYDRAVRFSVAFMGFDGGPSVHSGGAYLRPQLVWDVVEAPAGGRRNIKGRAAT
jgi:lipopolysaccharide transport system ATP-binding protein